MSSLQSLTVEYVVSGSLDGTTPAPRIVIDPSADNTTPVDTENQIYRVEVENLGLIDPDLGVSGSIGPRCIPFLWIDTETLGEVGAAVEVVGIIEDTAKRQLVAADLAGDAGVYLDAGIMVPQGSAIRLSGFAAGPDPIVVRVSIVIPKGCLDFVLAALTLTEETAPPAVTCCSPTYLIDQAWRGEPIPNIGSTVDVLVFAATSCGENEPITAEFRSFNLAPLSPAPLVTGVSYDPVTASLSVSYDSTLSPDGDWVLEITNGCGCCTIAGFTIQTG